MSPDEKDFLLEQLRCVASNRPLSGEVMPLSPDAAELREMILCISDRVEELNGFLRSLSAGHLEAQPPREENPLAADAKALHAELKRLAGQAEQNINGNTARRFDFSGDFFTAFGTMLSRVHEWESEIRSQSDEIERTIEMMQLVMDGLKDWVMVLSAETGELIYANQSARREYYDDAFHQMNCGQRCGGPCGLMSRLLQAEDPSKQEEFEYLCSGQNQTFNVRTFPFRWKNESVRVCYITNITDEKRRRGEMETFAYKDELTGLHNRRYCIDKLRELIGHGDSFALCMADIDGLKYANDQFGHQAGDEYLIRVAHELLRVARSSDIVCRLGGDEFIILFPNCPVRIAQEKMELVDRRLALLPSKYPMSISFGVISVDENADFSAEELLEDADRKMYLLKRSRKSEKAPE